MVKGEHVKERPCLLSDFNSFELQPYTTILCACYLWGDLGIWQPRLLMRQKKHIVCFEPCRNVENFLVLLSA